jgi:methyl coenzyme M reductase subunit C
LRAQANAEHRFAGGDGLANRGHFHGEVRVMVYLVAVHRAAEHDQAVIAAEVGYGIRLAAEVLVADAKAGIAQQGVERAEYFVRNVLEDKQAMHGPGNPLQL